MSSSMTKYNKTSCSNSILSSSSVNASSMSPKENYIQNNGRKKKACMCSPTTHPGSFRCSMHKDMSNTNDDRSIRAKSHRSYVRGSAMTNTVVRVGTVEGELVKRLLKSLIRPSSRQQRRRGEFHPRPSRLSVMSKAEE